MRLVKLTIQSGRYWLKFVSIKISQKYAKTCYTFFIKDFPFKIISQNVFPDINCYPLFLEKSLHLCNILYIRPYIKTPCRSFCLMKKIVFASALFSISSIWTNAETVYWTGEGTLSDSNTSAWNSTGSWASGSFLQKSIKRDYPELIWRQTCM